MNKQIATEYKDLDKTPVPLSADVEVVPVWIPRLLLVALILALVTVSVSSYIRLVESGIGCSDWPNCYGYYHNKESAQGINVLTIKGVQSPHRMARVIHRLVTSVLGFIILFIFFVSLRKNYGPMLGRAVPSGLLFLTLLLASIGSIHSQQPLPLLTLANFIGGLLLVVLISYLYVRLIRSGHIFLKTPLNRLIRFASLIILLQVIWGGWTSANYSGSSCDGLFSCQDKISIKNESNSDGIRFISALKPVNKLPLDINSRVKIDKKQSAIQLVHHVLAVISLASFIALVLLVMRSDKQIKKQLQGNCFVMLALLVIQFLLGILALILQLPLVVIVMHNLLTAVLLILITSLNITITPRDSL